MADDPLLSIVVTIVDGGTFTRDFLDALRRLEDAPPLEIIVPFDASVEAGLAWRHDYGEVQFLELGEIVPERPITSEAGQHELFDRRRAAGLAAAQGDLIAILEDRGHPTADWAWTVVRLHRDLDAAVIGGAIDCKEPTSLLNWAFYVTDFGKYGRPFDSGSVSWVSDVNVTYSRQILEDTRHLWRNRYREPVVHWFLIERGETLFLSNELVVEHTRPRTTLRELLPERFHWGRLFGHIRAMHVSGWRRLALSLAGPLIPPVLWVRHGMVQASKGRLLRYLKALPLIMVLTIAWTMGEVWGYITRKA